MANEAIFGPISLPLSIAISVFRTLVSSFGLAFGIAFVPIILMLIYDSLKVFFMLMKALFSKKPEGTSILDSIMYDIGHGHESKGEIAFGFLLIVVGIGLAYFSPELVDSSDIQEKLLLNPLKSIGGAIMGVGFVIVYVGIKELLKTTIFGSTYQEDPELKKMKTDMMTAFKQGKTLDAINLFEMDLKSLNEQFKEANAIKYGFEKEEKQINQLIKIFKNAEKYCSEGEIKKADGEVNSAKRQYDVLRPKITQKLRHYKNVKSVIAELKKMSSNIEELIKDSERSKLDSKIEDDCYKRLDMNRVLLSSQSFWRSDNFREARGELETLRKDYAKIQNSLKEKLGTHNEMLSRKFPCLKCGKNMNMTHEACPSCGTKPAETILGIMRDLITELEETATKMDGAKWLIDFEGENSGFEEIQVALDNITKQVEKREYDKSTSLLMSTKASHEALVSEVKEKLSIYDKIYAKISELKTHSVDIDTLIQKNKANGVDVGEEEKQYAAISEKTSNDAIEAVCKSGAFSDANSRLEKAIGEYDSIKTGLTKKMDKYEKLSGTLTKLEKLYSDTQALLEDAKTKKVDVSIEERNLRAINVNRLKENSKNITKETEEEIKKRLSDVEKTKESLNKKVEMYNRLKNMGSILEERANEVRGLISKGVALKLDVKEEHEKFYGIKLDSIRDMLKSCEDIVSLKKELDNALDTTQWCIASLSDKLSSVDDAPRWAEAVESAMGDKDMIEISSLRSVPEEWRTWAAERYMDSHSNYAFVIHKDLLIKTMPIGKKREYDEVLKALISSGKILGCGVFDDRGIVVTSEFPNLKSVGQLGEPFGGIIGNARELSKWSGIGGVKKIVISADEFKIVVNEIGKGLFLLSSVKPKENIGFISIITSKGLKGLKELNE